MAKGRSPMRFPRSAWFAIGMKCSGHFRCMCAQTVRRACMCMTRNRSAVRIARELHDDVGAAK